MRLYAHTIQTSNKASLSLKTPVNSLLILAVNFEQRVHVSFGFLRTVGSAA